MKESTHKRLYIVWFHLYKMPRAEAKETGSRLVIARGCREVGRGNKCYWVWGFFSFRVMKCPRINDDTCWNVVSILKQTLNCKLSKGEFYDLDNHTYQILRQSYFKTIIPIRSILCRHSVLHANHLSEKAIHSLLSRLGLVRSLI